MSPSHNIRHALEAGGQVIRSHTVWAAMYQHFICYYFVVPCSRGMTVKDDLRLSLSHSLIQNNEFQESLCVGGLFNV